MSNFNCEDNATYIPGEPKITPTGTIEITENGTVDVTQYANADVNVSGGGGDDSFAKLVDGSITTANIPSGVTRIKYNAFAQCANLTSVSIPSGVTSIENSAFAYCSNLTSINIPSGVTSIGSTTFNGCANLTSIDLPSGVTSIGSSAFAGCSNLTSITVRAIKPPKIQNNTFNGVPSTANIYVPSESVETYKAASYWNSRAAYIQAISE